MTTAALFNPVRVGALLCPNRIVMAPMSRQRCGTDQVATPLMAEYYAQRADAGLLISEATSVAEGAGNPHTPAIYTQAHADGWRQVTEAVHARGGRIVLQLSHLGRVAHPSMHSDRQRPVAPSALRMPGLVETPTGLASSMTPHCLKRGEIREIIASYGAAARLARQAGFDGIDVLAAAGYLIEQFLRDGTNVRTDAYGGSVANRARFLTEVLSAICEEWSPDRVGVHLAPMWAQNGVTDSDPQATLAYVLERLSGFGVAYVCNMEASSASANTLGERFDVAATRRIFCGMQIVSGGYTPERAAHAIRRGLADLVAFGTPFIANPDLVQRIAEGSVLNRPEQSTVFGGGARGYTDYPSIEQQNRRA